jgi:hypothetical protein
MGTKSRETIFGSSSATEGQGQQAQNEAVEALRASYRPSRITTLFVGESAPISGDFFYDGRDHRMVKHMRQALDSALSGEGISSTAFARAAGISTT